MGGCHLKVSEHLSRVGVNFGEDGPRYCSLHRAPFETHNARTCKARPTVHSLQKSVVTDADLVNVRTRVVCWSGLG